MEKRFTAKADDNNTQDSADIKTRVILAVVSGLLIIGIGFAAAMAISMNKKPEAQQSSSESATAETTLPSATDAPVSRFETSYPDGTVPTDAMSLTWGMTSADIKIKYPDVLLEKPSALTDEKNTVNISYELNASVGGFPFSYVVLGADRSDGLYSFSYLLKKDDYSAINEALIDEYGRPVFKSSSSAYWYLDERVLLYLTVREDEADGQEHTVIQYIDTKGSKAPENPAKTPVLELGMTVEEVRNRKLRMEILETAADGTETYMIDRAYDFSSDVNIGRFAPGNSTAGFLYFSPKAGLVSYSFVIPGDHLYEVREKLAGEFGSPAVNHDYGSQWNTIDGKASIAVSYGRMTGSGRGFATEIRYSCSRSLFESMEMIKAVGRATRKGAKYSEVKNEIGKYGPADKVDRKGNGTITLINRDGNNIIVFGVMIKSVEIEFKKNKVTDVYYSFDGSAYDSLKMNIETNFGPGAPKLRFKDRIKRYQWIPKTTEKSKFTRIMLDYVNLKVNPKARVHYYG